MKRTRQGRIVWALYHGSRAGKIGGAANHLPLPQSVPAPTPRRRDLSRGCRTSTDASHLPARVVAALARQKLDVVLVGNAAAAMRAAAVTELIRRRVALPIERRMNFPRKLPGGGSCLWRPASFHPRGQGRPQGRLAPQTRTLR